MRSALIVASLSLAFCMFLVIKPTPVFHVTPAQTKEVFPGGAAAHHIRFETGLGDEAACSATAVGKHTLLTAAHCIIGTGKVNVDGKFVNISRMAYDEKDHVLLVIDMAFPKAARINERALNVTEHVRIWGWPGKALAAVYREGFLMSTDEDGWYTLQLAVFPGDSGSGVVTDDGQVVTVVSMADKSATTVCLPMAFTPEQLSHVQ